MDESQGRRRLEQHMLREAIRQGTAQELHLVSLGGYIGNALIEEAEHLIERKNWLRKDWTDPKYVDSITEEEFDAEWNRQWAYFIKYVESGGFNVGTDEFVKGVVPDERWK